MSFVRNEEGVVDISPLISEHSPRASIEIPFNPNQIKNKSSLYSVQKVFQFGSRAPRLLKLTSRGIQNCQIDGSVSSHHNYSSVISVTLKGNFTLIISYDGDHDYTYETPQAEAILHEITQKAASRKYNMKKRVNREIIHKFHEVLDNYSKNPKVTRGNAVSLPSDPPEILAQSKNEEGNQEEARKFETKKMRVKYPNENILNQRILAAFVDILTTPNSLEDITISAFVRNFDSNWKSSGNPGYFCRDFMNLMTQNCIKQHMPVIEQRLGKWMEELLIQEKPDLELILERCLQQLIVLPLHEKIWQYLKSQQSQADSVVKEKMTSLKRIPPEVFGISKGHSKIEWKHSVKELESIYNGKSLPLDKMECIMETCRNIANLMTDNFTSSGFVSADEFLPVLIHVLCRTNLEDLETLTEYLFSLCSPGYVAGEMGYYLTAVASAIGFIKDLDVDEFLSEGNREVKVIVQS